MYRFFIKGVVQGVGFRPYVYNACVSAGLCGYVKNMGDGVEIVADDADKVREILKGIPPLARVDSVSFSEFDPDPSSDGSYDSFSIISSSGGGYAEVPPDLFLCADCLRELRDNSDRRAGYFFITCTNCGPRFSMTLRSPYDRCTTSMADFEMCPACSVEYKDPADRRYHAQTIACPECGPKLYYSVDGNLVCSDGSGGDAVKRAADDIIAGEVVAVKGVGGFHLACKADSNSVSKLRELTGRKDKPYAVMMRDLDMVKRFALSDRAEQKMLESVERPIVLLKMNEYGREVLGSITELDTVGVMFPYTALHYLLFDHVDCPIILTSANLPDNPITTDSSQQFVSRVLSHDRRIVNPVDDSVVKLVGGNRLFLRRSRGFVPRSISLPDFCKGKSVLALGAEMNSAFCIVNDGRAVMSQFLGNTSNADAFEMYKRTVDDFLSMISCKPDVIVCDMHPSYNTSAYASVLGEKFGVPVERVQHHVAHAYSVFGEKAAGLGLSPKAGFISIVCDGLGYGDDGTVWGGEVFVGDKRVGGLEQQYLLGGDSAAERPAKFLYSVLSKVLDSDELRSFMSAFFDSAELDVLSKQLSEKFNCPVTTSCGRILDAAAVMLGFCDSRTYDGRPAMVLEANSTLPYPLEPVISDGVLLIVPLFKYLLDNVHRPRERLAATVQKYIAEGLYKIASDHARLLRDVEVDELSDDIPIFFSGGCAYNRIMTSFMVEKGVLVNNEVPCGDGGVAFGQAVKYLTGN